MKLKTVSVFALTVSSAFAFIGPGVSEKKTICLDAHEDKNGVLYAGSCDQSKNNEDGKVKLLENGCADGQISLVAIRGKNYNITVPTCLPPNVVQL